MKSWKQSIREFLKATFYGEEKGNIIKKGWHNVLCACGHKQGTVRHYGGTKRIPICPPCKNVPDECIDCYLINRERKKCGEPPLKVRMKTYRKALHDSTDTN